METEKGNSFTRWIRRHPVWAIALIGLGGLLVGVAIGISDTSDLDAANEKVTKLETDLEASKAEVDEKASELDELQSAADRVAAKSERMDAKAKKISAREKEVEATETQAAKNSIDDGIWKVGTDFETGTYRAEAGSDCYWALLGSADTSDIINNGGFSPNQTLTIDSPWFETSDCGTWEKIE